MKITAYRGTKYSIFAFCYVIETQPTHFYALRNRKYSDEDLTPQDVKRYKVKYQGGVYTQDVREGVELISKITG